MLISLSHEESILIRFYSFFFFVLLFRASVTEM